MCTVRRLGTMKVELVLALTVTLLCFCEAKLSNGDCEVCIGFLQKFERHLKENSLASASPDQLELELMKTCRDAKNKEERFCYYIGAAATSATKLTKEVTRPMSYGKPAEKICEELKKKDQQICDLRYDKVIDWNSVELKSLKVRDLRKILSEWDVDCIGCAEKRDFIEKINEVKHLHIEL